MLSAPEQSKPINDIIKAYPKDVLGLIFRHLSNRDISAFALTCKAALEKSQQFIYEVVLRSNVRNYFSVPTERTLMVPHRNLTDVKKMKHCLLAENLNLFTYPDGTFLLLDQRKMLTKKVEQRFDIGETVFVQKLNGTSWVTVSDKGTLHAWSLDEKRNFVLGKTFQLLSAENICQIQQVQWQLTTTQRNLLVIAYRTTVITTIDTDSGEQKHYHFTIDKKQSVKFADNFCEAQKDYPFLTLWSCVPTDNPGMVIVQLAHRLPRSNCALSQVVKLSLFDRSLYLISKAHFKLNDVTLNPCQIVMQNKWGDSVIIHESNGLDHVMVSSVQSGQKHRHVHPGNKFDDIPKQNPYVLSNGNLAFFTGVKKWGKQELVMVEYPQLKR